MRRDKGAAGGIGIRQWRLMPGRKKVVQGEKEGDEEDDRACTDNTGHLACRVLMSSYLGMVARPTTLLLLSDAIGFVPEFIN